jgi:hypothetical protein
MSVIDEWGRDPAVRAMRKIFRAMDKSQREFFNNMGIDMYDGRIRAWREKALVLFEKTFSMAHRKGIQVNEEAASNIYLHCLAKVLREEGIEVPETYLPNQTSNEI